MDKAILKKFAIESRQDLMVKIKNKINTYYIDEEFAKEQKGDLYILSNSKHTLSLTNEEYKKRELLIKRIKELSLEQVIEEAAYTWFNRIIAIRYMEINDMLPLTRDNQSLGIRVLSSKDNTPDPEILKFTNLMNPDLDIEFKKEKYAEIKDENEKFKYILLLVCKKLGRVIPQVFDGITDYIDILIPDNLLNDTGFIAKIVNEVSEDNYSQVEIIGWLYQYYNQTEKDRVISAKKQYKKNEIAYATQLFTPDWIVKYMVENSLGRYWIEHGGDKKITEKWRFFVKDNIKISEKKIKPTEIKCIDPCCGSGHILVYMFEVLYQIYDSYGYSKNDIAELILKNNIYGLDMDDRAGQLSILSILLKAREYDKNIFNKSVVKDLNLMSIQESKNISSIIQTINPVEKNKELYKYLDETFRNAKEIGSLLILKNNDYSEIEKEINDENTIFGIELREKVIPLIKQAKILSKKYDVVITNPPYMGEKYMSEIVKNYIRNNYYIGRSDMFSTFILCCCNMAIQQGNIGLLTPYSWMFLDSYKELREYMINNISITSLVQLEYNSFEAAALPVCTFCLYKEKNITGSYIRLSDFTGPENQPIKLLEALNNKVNYYYHSNMDDYSCISGSPIAYWISSNIRNVFKNAKTINDFGTARQGMTTSDNKRFLRLWYEVNKNKINCDATSIENAKESQKKWFPYNKGGKFRKWYGNNEYVVNFYNDGEEMEAFHKELNKTSSGGRIKSKEYYFKEAITWTFISSTSFGVRYSKSGAIFDVAGSSLFTTHTNIYYILGFLCSNLIKTFNQITNPTMNVQSSNISQLPLIIDNKYKDVVDEIVKQNIEISKDDWDSYEMSWDFEKHPFIKYKQCSIEKTYNEWNKITKERFNQLKTNEEEINKIFINIYGLQDELDFKVNYDEISIKLANTKRDVKSFINYAVGCMFGRYSLDESGLVYAGGEFDSNRYKTYKADIDNIIPITDDGYFNDDIVERFKKFIEVVYGKETLNENIDYIAETLGKKGTETSEDTIRRYFVNDFFNDHCELCSVIGSGKRPIYWLFDSGKKNGFKALIYMHRYNENLIPKVRLDYLHKLQTTYEKLLTDVNYKLTTDLSMQEKKMAQLRQTELNGKLQEIKEYDEKIAHIANQRISIDLDDGVIVNYDKFKDILAKIK